MEDRHWHPDRAAALYARAARSLAETAEGVLAAVRADRTAGLTKDQPGPQQGLRHGSGHKWPDRPCCGRSAPRGRQPA